MRPWFAASLLLAAGCRGSADYSQGEEYYRQGRFREAYQSFWLACAQRECTEYRDALKRSGAEVGETERRAGRILESRGEPAAALQSYALGLEYDPSSPRLRSDFDRVWRMLEDAATLRDRWEAWADGRAAGPAMEQLRIGHEMAALEVGRGPSIHDLQAAARSSADRLLSPLRDSTFAEPLPEDRTALASLRAAWLEAAEDLGAWVQVEEDEAFSHVTARKALAAGRPLAEALRDAIDQAEDGARRVDEALEGVRLYDQGASLEARGDFARAFETYVAAAQRHPSHDGVRRARSRALRKLLDESWQSALAAARHKDWRSAIPALETILAHDPRRNQARDLLLLARTELGARYVEEARQFEEANQPGNAIVRYLAAEALPGAGSSRAAAARLSATLLARLRPHVMASIRPIEPEERRARRDLWGVADDAISRLEHDLLDSIQEEIDSSSGGGGERGPLGAPEIVLEVEDVDFSYPRGEPSAGSETSRFVSSFLFAVNPSRAAAEERLVSARVVAASAAAAGEEAAAHKISYAAASAALASARRQHAEAVAASLAERVPVIQWGTVTYPTQQVMLRVEVAARYRFDGEERWVSASVETVDRVVKGNLGKGVPPDPEEFLARAEALRVLAPRLGRAVGADAKALLAVRHERLYRQALDHLSSGAADVAVENLVLFLFARRDESDPLVLDARRRVKALTGCDVEIEPRG